VFQLPLDSIICGRQEMIPQFRISIKLMREHMARFTRYSLPIRTVLNMSQMQNNQTGNVRRITAIRSLLTSISGVCPKDNPNIRPCHRRRCLERSSSGREIMHPWHTQKHRLCVLPKLVVLVPLFPRHGVLRTRFGRLDSAPLVS
jgi:hypothetical protein